MARSAHRRQHRPRHVPEAAVVAALAIVVISLPLALLRRSPGVKVGTDVWVAAWVAPMEPASAVPAAAAVFPQGHATDQTVRQVVRPSIDGRALRLHFSNAYGDTPLTLSRVLVAPLQRGQRIGAGRQAFFGGRYGAVIGPGADATSQPIAMAVYAGEAVAVSVAVSGRAGVGTVHPGASRLGWVSEPHSGDRAGDRSGVNLPRATRSWWWLDRVEVLERPGATRTIVVLGGTITAGAGFTADVPTPWPVVLSDELNKARPARARPWAVLDASLPGNSLLGWPCASCGPPAARRFNRDVLSQPGSLRAVIIEEGTDDIARGASPAVVAHALAALAATAHAYHLVVLGCTIPPRVGDPAWNPRTAEQTRTSVNGWIRGSGAFDAVIDADLALHDPADPTRLLQSYDAGNHINLSADGQSALATTVMHALVPFLAG